MSATTCSPADTDPVAVERRGALAEWWPLAALAGPGGGAAVLDARSAELLVRRGVHPRARAARESRGDAALCGSHREHAAAVVRADLGMVADLRHRRDRAASAFGVVRRGNRPVAWAIGRELTGRRATAIAAAAFVAVNPLFVWYSQEARAYGLFVLMSALAMLCFLRAQRAADTEAIGGLRRHGLAGAVEPLLRGFPGGSDGRSCWCARWHRAPPAGADRRASLLACAVPVLVGLALLPLASAQGGSRRAVDRRMGAHKPATGDPAVLPDRLHGGAARARHRAARGIADPRWSRLRPVERARAERGAGRADRAEHRGLRECCCRSCWSPSAPTTWRPAISSRR